MLFNPTFVPSIDATQAKPICKLKTPQCKNDNSRYTYWQLDFPTMFNINRTKNGNRIPCDQPNCEYCMTSTAKLPSPKMENSAKSRSQLKRENIIRNAATLFLEKGYDSVSINDIIDVIGGSKGTIYSNFGNKEKLFEAVVQQACSDVTVSIDITYEGTIDEQLHRLARSFLKKLLTPEALRFHRLMTSMGRTFPKAGRWFFEAGPATSYSIIAKWVEHHQKAGTISDHFSPLRLAIMLHSMLICEHQMRWMASSEEQADKAAKINDTVELASFMFLGGCKNDPN